MNRKTCHVTQAAVSECVHLNWLTSVQKIHE